MKYTLTLIEKMHAHWSLRSEPGFAFDGSSFPSNTFPLTHNMTPERV